MTKNKHIFIFLTVALLLLSNNFVLALNAPIVGLTDNSGLGDYIVVIFKFSIGIAGLLAMIGLAIGGVTLIMSGGNPGMRSEGLDKIKGAILGLVLLTSAYIILNTINPQLTKPAFTTELPSLPGVVLTNGTDEKPAPDAVADTDTLKPYNTILYKCNEDPAQNPALLIWKFPKKNLEGNGTWYNYGDIGKDAAKEKVGGPGYDGITVETLLCGKSLKISFSSYRMEFERAGVYFFLGNGCSGFMSGPHTGSVDNIGDPFVGNLRIIEPEPALNPGPGEPKTKLIVKESKEPNSNNTKSIRIVNKKNSSDPLKNNYYGAILHSEVGLGRYGKCSDEQINLNENSSVCQPVYMAVGAVDIFSLNKNPATSGTGVSLYSEPYGWNKGARAGFCHILSDSSIPPKKRKGAGFCSFPSGDSSADRQGAEMNPIFEENAENLILHYDNIDRKEKYTTMCATFKSCYGSIQIKRNFLVDLYEFVPNSDTGVYDIYCQTFTNSIPNLNAQEIKAAGRDNIKGIIVIPTK